MTLPDFLTEWSGNEIVLTGHRIGIYTIIRCYREGQTAAQMAEEFPTLPLELIEKVLAFYLANRPEWDRYADEYRAEIERQAAITPRVDMAKIRRRFAELYPERAKELFGPDA